MIISKINAILKLGYVNPNEFALEFNYSSLEQITQGDVLAFVWSVVVVYFKVFTR